MNLFARLMHADPDLSGGTAAAAEAPASMDATLNALMDKMEAGGDETATDDAGTEPGSDAADAGRPANTGRARDANGKFAKPAVTATTDPGEAATAVTKPADGTDPAATAPVASKHPEPPKSWNTEERADWEKLPENYRAAAHRREENFFKGIEQYKGKAQTFDAIDAVIRPHAEIFKLAGQNAVENVGSLLNLQQVLYTGSDDQKIATLLQVASNVGIKPELLLAGLQNPPQQPAQDPRYDTLAKRLEQTEARLSEAALKPVQTEVERFWADPKNEYLGEPGVADLMTKLITSGVATSTQEAYDKACALSDTVKAKVAAKAAEAESKAQAERAAAEAKRKADLAAKAQKASSMNVRTRGVTTGTPTKKGTLEDTIGSTFDAIAARQGA
jgi:hypothetical protein